MGKKKRIWFGFATFVGTVIGVGLFGLPYVGAQSGFLILFFYLIAVSGIVIAINFAYAYVITHTNGLHRLPGYAGIYFGSTAQRITFVIKSLAIFGALLAYLIIGGEFLAHLLNGPVYLYTFIFFIAAALLIWRDQQSIGPVELVMLFVFILAVLILFCSGIRHMNPTNLMPVHWGKFFAPYGVVLFSLWGTSIIPEVKEIVGGTLKRVREIIVVGIILSAVVFLLFSMLVISISGAATSEDGISGLVDIVGPWVIKLGYFFGILTTFTSFIALGLTVKKVFWYDYRLPRPLGWALACFIPLLLYILGFQSFIDIISITGAVTLGGSGIIVMLLYLRVHKKVEYGRAMPLHYKVSSLTLIGLLTLGVVLEVLYFFKII